MASFPSSTTPLTLHVPLLSRSIPFLFFLRKQTGILGIIINKINKKQTEGRNVRKGTKIIYRQETVMFVYVGIV